jgi:hypothetical protein
MARLVRHRQPKGPVTDRPSLKPPRHISTLRRQPFRGGPWYVGRSELEYSAARKRNQPIPGIAGKSESLRNKRVRVVHSFNPQRSGWRCNACLSVRFTLSDSFPRYPINLRQGAGRKVGTTLTSHSYKREDDFPQAAFLQAAFPFDRQNPTQPQVSSSRQRADVQGYRMALPLPHPNSVLSDR